MNTEIWVMIIGSLGSIAAAWVGKEKETRATSSTRRSQSQGGRPYLVFGLILAVGIAITALTLVTMQIRASQVRIEKGSVGTMGLTLRSDKDGRQFYEGTHSFNPPFPEPPALVTSLSHLDITGKLDVAITHEEPTTTGFRFAVRFAKDTNIDGITASWMAIGKRY